MIGMPPTSEQLWDAIERIYNEDGTADRIFPSVVAKLIEFKMVTLDKAGLPQLTEHGHKCYRIFESGDDAPTEINDVAAMEYQQRQGNDVRVK
jgi:hypothetical protein